MWISINPRSYSASTVLDPTFDIIFCKILDPLDATLCGTLHVYTIVRSFLRAIYIAFKSMYKCIISLAGNGVVLNGFFKLSYVCWCTHMLILLPVNIIVQQQVNDLSRYQ